MSGTPDLSRCPVHGQPWRDGRRGWFCPARAQADEVADRNGYCGLTPAVVAAKVEAGGSVIVIDGQPFDADPFGRRDTVLPS